ncbi:hypothetical protein MB46_19330 (plasmid) [Arthrobacter alpinus]|nr:hypothetical protein MB46_19330 [Arthrobacter alpinus]
MVLMLVCRVHGVMEIVLVASWVWRLPLHWLLSTRFWFLAQELWCASSQGSYAKKFRVLPVIFLIAP